MANEVVKIREITLVSKYESLAGPVEEFVVISEVYDDSERSCQFISIVKSYHTASNRIGWVCVYNAQHTSVTNHAVLDNAPLAQLITNATRDAVTAKK